MPGDLEKLPEGPIDVWDFQAQTGPLACGQHLTYTGLYLTASIGLAGMNFIEMAHLGAFLRLMTRPWATLADWNPPPDTPRQSSWIREIGDTVVTP